MIKYINDIIELTPQYDTRKSFYKKAQIRRHEDEHAKTRQLLSYNTLVANIVEYKDKIIFENFGKYSQTTTRHQKEFFKHYGLTDEQIKELFKNGRMEVVK